MACCGGGEEVSTKNHERIEKELKDSKKTLDREVKLLLLGAGESGKSTIAKQMKILYKESFSEEERNSYKSIIYNNCVSSMRTIVKAANSLGITVQAQDSVAKVLEGNEDYFSGPIDAPLATAIKSLWADPGIKSTYEQSNKYQLIDSASYYFDNIDRIAAPNYSPNEQDVLRSRAKTTGIIEIEFEIEKTKFRMVDVGGQRSERKKWMHCFQDVTAVIFCVALSEYDLKLQEDDTTNRMMESLKLFKEICNSKWFTDTSMILFLNKEDLFAEKIKKVDLKVCFPEYTGGMEFQPAVDFIRDKFISQNENPQKNIYPQVTRATDTNNVKVVFNAVKDTILRRALDSAGIL